MNNKDNRPDDNRPPRKGGFKYTPKPGRKGGFKPGRKSGFTPGRKRGSYANQPSQKFTPPPSADAAKATKPTHWGEVAKWYDDLVGEEGSEYHRQVVLPGTVRLLDLKPGDLALDAACGQGVLCRILHRGGVKATGVDAAAELIDIARQRSDPSIDFKVGDVRDLSALPAEHYHAAAIVLSIQNVDPIAPVLASIARCLVAGGRLVMVMMHPCFRGPKATSWGWDDHTRGQYRRVDRYLSARKEPIAMHPGSDPDQVTWSFHRSMQDYVKALRKAGLLIDTIEEWISHKTSEQGPRAEAEDASRKEIPMFMAIRALKVGGQ